MKSLSSVLESWANTPFGAGQCEKQHGVDCVRFVDAAIAEWRGYSFSDPLPRHAQQQAFHDPRIVASMETLLKIRHCYERVQADPDALSNDLLRPGHVIAVAMLNNPFHLYIADGPRLWHASEVGVAWTSLEAVRSIVTVRRWYKPKDQ